MLSNLVLPTYYIKIKNVVICGMGGSGLGGDVVKYLMPRLQRPLTVVHDYDIPNFVDNETLLILISYSGNTEETIECYKQGIKKNARIFVVSTGGVLIDMAKSDGLPFFQYEYSCPPRYAVGYSFTAILGILNKLAVINLSQNQIKESILLLSAWVKKLSIDVPASRNSAKQLAQKLVDRIPVVIGQAESAGVNHIWKTHFNETAKTASYSEDLPDLNHYAVTGSKFPKKLVDRLFFIILQSKYSNPRLKLQENLFIQSLDKAGLDYEAVFMHPTNDIISEIYLNILFGLYTAYYLAILNKVNPSETPLQEFIKNTLSEK